MEGIYASPFRFLGANAAYETATHVIVGVPLDLTSCYRRGTRGAPDAIRRVSDALEYYSFDLKKDLRGQKLCDPGNLNLNGHSVETALDAIGRVFKQILRDGKFPIALGGEHLISLPIVKEMVGVYPDLAVIHFDAHLDLRREYEGRVLSHATVMHHVLSLVKEPGLVQFGIRSGDKEESEIAAQRGTVYPCCPEGMTAALSKIAGRPLYVSVDLDCLDPAAAPGVSTPEPGGLSFLELMDLIRVIPKGDIKGFDVVELCPQCDTAEITAFAAAKITRELILSCC